MISGRRVIIALWVVGLLIAGSVIMRTEFSTDMSAFLPRSPVPAQQILVDQLREGVVSRLVLLAIEGAPTRDAGRAQQDDGRRPAHGPGVRYGQQRRCSGIRA